MLFIDKIIDWLATYAPTALVVIAIVYFAIKLTILFRDFVHKVNKHDEDIKTTTAKVETLPCDKHQERFDKQMDILTKIQNELVEIRNKMAMKDELIEIRHTMAHKEEVAAIQNALAFLNGKLDKKATNNFAKAHSPLALTDKGVEVSNVMKMEARVGINWEKICKTLDEEVTDKNAYDIQQYCIFTAAVHPEKFLSDIDIHDIKLYAYQTGNSFDDLSIVPALIIRDRYFAERNIPTSDVDRFDPDKKQA